MDYGLRRQSRLDASGSGGMVVHGRRQPAWWTMARRIMHFLRARILRLVHPPAVRHHLVAQDAGPASTPGTAAPKISISSGDLAKKHAWAATFLPRLATAAALAPRSAFVQKWRKRI